MYIPINSDTGLDQVHYTWAGAAVLEALCLVYPTVNFVLADSDCVPTSLFEVAELVNLMTDRASRAEAMQHHTMASSNQCPPTVLLMTESKAELNAGLIIVTGHAATQAEDVDMGPEPPNASMPASAAHSDACDARAHKSRRLAHPADIKSPTGRKKPAQLQARHTPRNTSYFTSPCSQLVSILGAMFSECLIPTNCKLKSSIAQGRCWSFAPLPQRIGNHHGQDTCRTLHQIACSTPIGRSLLPDTLPAESLKFAGYMVGSLFLRGHSAGSYAGMVWETILAVPEH